MDGLFCEVLLALEITGLMFTLVMKYEKWIRKNIPGLWNIFFIEDDDEQ